MMDIHAAQRAKFLTDQETAPPETARDPLKEFQESINAAFHKPAEPRVLVGGGIETNAKGNPDGADVNVEVKIA